MRAPGQLSVGNWAAEDNHKMGANFGKGVEAQEGQGSIPSMLGCCESRTKVPPPSPPARHPLLYDLHCTNSSSISTEEVCCWRARPAQRLASKSPQGRVPRVGFPRWCTLHAPHRSLVIAPAVQAPPSQIGGSGGSGGGGGPGVWWVRILPSQVGDLAGSVNRRTAKRYRGTSLPHRTLQ